MSHNLLHQVQNQGVSVWLDGVTRVQLRSGELARLVDGLGVTGVTTNPTLFAASLADADAYAADVADMRARHLSSEEAARLLAAADVRTACDILLPVHEQTERADGWVSLEVNPAFADDLAATMADVRALAWLVDRPNLMVKIPATPAGITAIAVATGEGYNINATLIFSAESYREVLAAYTQGLEVARSAGLDISQIRSVASLFVSRIDVALAAAVRTPPPDQPQDQRHHHGHQHGRHAARHEHHHRHHPNLHHTGEDTGEHTGESTGGGLPALATGGHPFALAGVANARQIHAFYQEAMATVAWQELQAAGANPQRPLWASTGVKDPALDPTTYVASLVLPGTVNTMPLDTLLAAFETPEQVLPDGSTSDEAAELRRALDRLDAAGDPLMARLLHDGVAKFGSSWDSVLNALSAPVRAFGAGLEHSPDGRTPKEVWLV